MSNVTFKVKQQQNRLLENINRQVSKNLSVYVGVQSNGTRDEDKEINNARLAAVHEFGAEIKTKYGKINIPERSFIRASISKNADKYKKMNFNAAKKIIDGNLQLSVYLDALGTVGAQDIKKFAIDLKDPENAEITKRRKKSSNPLVDTKQMINAITHIVASKEDIEGETTRVIG